MNNNDMNIELLKAMRGVWIIEIENLERKLEVLKKKEDQYTIEVCMIFKGRLTSLNSCLTDLISILGE